MADHAEAGMPPEPGAPAPSPRPARKRLSVFIWFLQALVALLFLGAGIPKVATTDPFIAATPWAADVPRMLLLFIGTMEILGALGVVLPRLTGIAPILTPCAALGLSTIMLLSIGFHLSRAEWDVGLNLVLGILAGVVAYARWKLVP